VRNAWAKSLLLYNIQNPVRLDANIAGAAVELWKLLTNLYDKTSELALLYAEEQLRNLLSEFKIMDSNYFIFSFLICYFFLFYFYFWELRIRVNVTSLSHCHTSVT